jgi:hypothetical protein
MRASEGVEDDRCTSFFGHGWRVFSLGDDHYLWEPGGEYLIRLPTAVLAAWRQRPPPTQSLQEAVRGHH